MIERDLGIGPHLTAEPGIGGRLRERCEDFVVVEIPDHRGVPGGDYLVALVRAENWETNALVGAMSRLLGVSDRRISFAGTKDKRAITEQYFSFKGLRQDALTERLDLDGVAVLETFMLTTSVRMGDLAGNRFDIRVADPDAGRLDGVAPIAERLVAEGFPNYFHVQRFGSVRGNTHTIGRRIAAGDMQGAVDEIVGRPVPGEDEVMAEARRAYDAGTAPEDVMALFPQHASIERTALESLARRPGEPERAIAALPKNLQLMYVHAFGSYLFNLYLGRRLGEGRLAPEPGDVALDLDDAGRPDRERPHGVTSANAGKVAARCGARRAAVAGPVPGADILARVPEGPSRDLMAGIMEREGVAPEDFVVPELPYLTTAGTLRPLLAPLIDLERPDVARFRFRLPPGTYATAVMREFMKVEDTMRY